MPSPVITGFGITQRRNALFADPQSIYVVDNVVSLARTAVQGSSSVYEGSVTLDSTDQTTSGLPAENDLVLSVTHTRNKRKRSVIRYDHSGLFTGVVSGTLVPASASVYLVVDRPIGQYTDTSIEYLAKGLLYALFHGTDPNNLTTAASKFVNGES